MNRYKYLIAAISTIAVLSFAMHSASAQRKKTGRKWVDMDYGSLMSHSFQAEKPGKNIAYKGKWIRLGRDESASMLFDTDLMRWAGAWTESDCDWRNVIFDGSHGTHPRVIGDQIFGNPILPGWSLTKEFSDPRELPYGPLPKEQIEYKGLYRHQNKVILAYRVGDTNVLEMASKDGALLSRCLEIGPNSKPIYLQIAFDERETQLMKMGDSNIAVFGYEKETKKTEVTTDTKEKVTKGLVAHWTFDEISDNTILNSVGKNFTGKIKKFKSIDGPEGKAIKISGQDIQFKEPVKLAGNNFTVSAYIRTTNDGTIAAKSAPTGKWVAKGKTFFVRGGKLGFDIGWVGAVVGKRNIADGKWHHVAMTHESSGNIKLFVDGTQDEQGTLESEDDESHLFRLGYTATNFMPAFNGGLDDVRFYDRALSPREIGSLVGKLDIAAPSVTAFSITGDGMSFDLATKNHVRAVLSPSKETRRFKISSWAGDQKELASFARLTAESKADFDLAAMTKGGPATSSETINTEGRRGKDDGPYSIDVITLPRENRWNSWIRPGGFDFFADDSKAAVCTWNGEVWTVSGIDDDFKKLTWRRIASGLFQPLGLKIIDGSIFVCCRDQITKLVDLNADGEIDFHQSFNHDHQVTEHFHEFAMDLQTDKSGNFYYAKSARHAKDSVVPHHGTIIKVSADGKQSEIVCNGFRAANGCGVGPNGEIITSDQEGHWTPANRLNLIKKDGFYGNMYSYHRGERPKDYDPPLVWLPKNVDRSPAAQFWCESDRWGPFSGKLLSTSYGTGKLWHVMYEEVNGVPQGGVVQMPVRFPTGIMRGRFRKSDGQLYLSGMVGWSSDTPQDGGLFRVRYTGKPVLLPLAMKVKEDGIELKFATPLDKDSAEDIDNYNIEQWNYRWSKNYGSPHFSVANPKKRGQDEVELWEATLSDDGKTLFLEIEDLQPVMQMQIGYTLKSKSGKPIKDNIWLTINNLP